MVVIICPQCKEEINLNEEELIRVGRDKAILEIQKTLVKLIENG